MNTFHVVCKVSRINYRSERTVVSTEQKLIDRSVQWARTLGNGATCTITRPDGTAFTPDQSMATVELRRR